jgi:hypothetical protein
MPAFTVWALVNASLPNPYEYFLRTSNKTLNPFELNEYTGLRNITWRLCEPKYVVSPVSDLNTGKLLHQADAHEMMMIGGVPSSSREPGIKPPPNLSLSLSLSLFLD